MKKIQRWCSKCRKQTTHSQIPNEMLKCGICGMIRSQESRKISRKITYRPKPIIVPKPKPKKLPKATKRILEMKIHCKKCQKSYAVGWLKGKPYCTKCFGIVKSEVKE